MSARVYRIPPDMPDSVRSRLGAVVDAEIADELDLHPETVRRWRLALGIPPHRKWRDSSVKRTRRNRRKSLTVVGRWARERDVAFEAHEVAAALSIPPYYLDDRIQAAFTNGEIVRVKGSRNRLWVTA